MSKHLFSEIFGCYYKIITEIVNNAPLTAAEVKDIINQNGFAESFSHLLPKIESLSFIEQKDGVYHSLLHNKCALPLTFIERAWLKAITADPRFALFADTDCEIKDDETEPLYRTEFFKYFDQYSDVDDFQNPRYQKYFRAISAAMDTAKAVKIVYHQPKKDKPVVGHYIPLQFEFSPKDNKFRVFAARILNEKAVNHVCLNLNRICDVKKSAAVFTGEASNLKLCLEDFDAKEPVTVEIRDERNAIERFMVEFSSYRKNSEFCDKTQTCTTKIHYRKTDETEVLIKLLSFGPTLKVLGPEPFLNLFTQRIRRQCEMLRQPPQFSE